MLHSELPDGTSQRFPEEGGPQTKPYIPDPPHQSTCSVGLGPAVNLKTNQFVGLQDPRPPAHIGKALCGVPRRQMK